METPRQPQPSFCGCVGGSTAVGNYPSGVSPYGVYDMAGNLWEWTASMYQPYPYIEGFDLLVIEYNNRVARGGSWDEATDHLRAANRTWLHPTLEYYFHLMGFRCAKSAAAVGN